MIMIWLCFIKQKTAYEMRISDWSSDVCSSDLLTRDPARGNAVVEIHNCYFNEGVVETDGVDLTVRTNFDLGAGGKLSNVLQLSHQFGYTIDGGAEQVGLQGFPETRATLNNQWSRGDWGVGYIARYIGANGEGASSTDSRTAEHTSELQTLIRTPYTVFRLKK